MNDITEVLILLAGIFLGIVIGWLFAIFKMAKDKTLVRLEKDYAIIKRPAEGFVLAQVTPEVLRQLLSKGGQLGGESEARTLSRRNQAE